MNKNLLIGLGLVALGFGGYILYKKKKLDSSYNKSMSTLNRKKAVVNFISQSSTSEGEKMRNILASMPDDDANYVYDYVINYVKTNRLSSLPNSLKSNIDRISKTYNIFS